MRQVSLRGLIDTGATRLVIPESVAQRLGVVDVGEAQVRHADNHTATRRVVDYVQAELAGRRATFHAIVEPDRDCV